MGSTYLVTPYDFRFFYEVPNKWEEVFVRLFAPLLVCNVCVSMVRHTHENTTVQILTAHTTSGTHRFYRQRRLGAGFPPDYSSTVRGN
jgi:hypothetical protein